MIMFSQQQRFRNKSSYTLKLLDQNCNRQQGFIKQKMLLSIIVVLSQNSLNTVIVITIIDEIVFTGDQNNIESDDYISTVALLYRFYFTLKLVISVGSFNEKWRFRIQDARLKKKSMKVPLILENQSMHPQQFYKKVFILQQIGALLCKSFPQKLPRCGLYIWQA